MKKLNIFYILGAILIVAGVAFIVINQHQVTNLQTNTEQAVTQITQIMPPRTNAVAEQYSNTSMPVYEIDGVDYCAMLECKILNINLPVADSWADAQNSTARCSGSVYDGTMIIGGQGLGFVIQLDLGDKISVVDMLGGEYSYTVEKIDRAKDVDMDKLSSTDYQLTIFSYITKEKKYVIVRCS